MYTIENIMELTGSTSPGHTIQYIKEAYREIAIWDNSEAITKDYHIIQGRIVYELPSDIVNLIGVYTKQTVYGSELMVDSYFEDASSERWTSSDLTGFALGGSSGTSYHALYGIAGLGSESATLDAEILNAGERYILEYTPLSGCSDSLYFDLDTGERLHNISNGDGIHRFEFIPRTTGCKLVIQATTASTTLHIGYLSLHRASKDKYKLTSRMLGDNPYEYFNEKQPKLEQWTEDESFRNIKNEDRLANLFDTDELTSKPNFSDDSEYLIGRMWGYKINGNRILLYEYNSNEDQVSAYPDDLLVDHFVPPTIDVENGLRLIYITGNPLFYTSSGKPAMDPDETSVIKDRDINVDAVIIFCKYRMAADSGNIDLSEYLLREFNTKIGKSKNAILSGSRIVKPTKIYSII